MLKKPLSNKGVMRTDVKTSGLPTTATKPKIKAKSKPVKKGK